MPGEDHYTIEQLFHLLVTDTDAALEKIYARYSRFLFRISNNILQDEMLAREVVMDVFFVLWKKRLEVSKMEKPGNWLYTLAYRKSLNALRSEKKRQQVFMTQEIDVKSTVNLVNGMKVKELRNYVNQSIQKLPSQQRKIIELVRDSDLSRKEIAYICNLSESTVKNHITKAYKNLRKILKDIHHYCM